MTTPSPRDLRGLRIALATDTWMPQVNGVTRTLARLATEARDRGGLVRVYTPQDPAADPDAVVRQFPSVPFWGYPQLRISWPGRNALVEEWRQWRPDLVHAATPFGVGLAARAAARQLGIPLVSSYHTSFSAYARFYRLGALTRPAWSFLRWFHNAGRRTWCPTRAIARELSEQGFTNTGIWGRGVDTTAFDPSLRSMEFRRTRGIGDSEFLVIYVGRLAREKGLDVLLHELRSYQAASSRPLRLMMVGDGPFESECRAGAPERTVFTGPLFGQELARAYASADLFVFPSLTETFGNVVLESLASGTPVLAADCEVSRELLEGGAGLHFDPAKPGDMAEVLDRAIRDPERLRALSERGRAVAESRTWDAVFDALFTDYLGVLRASGPPVINVTPSSARPWGNKPQHVVAHP
jgi:glycosyltransferase involved in cell wall biosynthesis